MNNDFGYIDNKPFKKINDKKQTLVILNEEEDNINVKINGVNTSEFSNMFVSSPGDLIESKTYYGVDSKFHPILLMNSHIINTNFSSISSTTITSNIYAKGKEISAEINHLTPETKIRKFDYYNDKLIYYYSDNPLTIKRKGLIKELNLTAKKTKPKSLFSMGYKGRIMKVFLVHSFVTSGNISKFSIKPNTYLEISFNKGIKIDDVINISSYLDSSLHLCILNNNKSYISTLYDYSKRKYNLYNYKDNINNKKEKNPTFNVCANPKERNTIFKGILSQFIDIDLEKNNSFFPFLNFYKKIEFHELEFLQYYKVIEVIDYEKQKNKGKGQDTIFLKKYLKKYSKLKNCFFGDYKEDKLEQEIRSLRNYYSHKGFYVEDLPVPTDKPIRFKRISIEWLYYVKRIVKIIAYLEMYEKAGVSIDELKLTYYLF